MPKSALSERMTSAKSDEWGSPPQVVRALKRQFDIRIDLAARATNKKAAAYLGPDHQSPELRDSLAVDWARVIGGFGPSAWGYLNPPFSDLEAFVEKCWAERQRGARIVSYLPHKTEAVWYHEIAPHADEIRMLRRRQVHELTLPDGSVNDDAAFFASAILIWDGRAPTFTTGPRLVWWDLGVAPRPRLVRSRDEATEGTP